MKSNLNNTVLTRVYGFIKAHKIDFPIRVIVSSINRPIQPLAKKFHEILELSIDRPNSYIKDS